MTQSARLASVRSEMWTLANILTLFRLAAAAPIALLVLAGTQAAAWAALALFAAAGASDYADGALARARGETSALGAKLDPLADKALSLAVFAALIVKGSIAGVHLLPVAAIAVREIAVAVLRAGLERRGRDLPVAGLSKLKTALQFLSAAALIAPSPGMAGPGLAVLWAAAALTLLTGARYAAAGLRGAAPGR